ncbi:MAG: hypothetical protein JXL80_04325 [Planctomycetes bacterium]|nr:hypothetical protein [Planctomycetota bacterium]
MRTGARFVVVLLVATWSAAAWGEQVSVGPRGQVTVDGKAVIPFGVWQQPQQLMEYHHMIGLNCLIWPPSSAHGETESTSEYVAAAKAKGLGAILHYKPELADLPGVWGWIGGGWPVSDARQRYEFIRNRDRTHLIQANFGAHGLINRNDPGDLEYYKGALPYIDSVVSHAWPEMFEGEPRNLRNVALLVDSLRELCAGRPRGEVSIWPDINPHRWNEKEVKGHTLFESPTQEELRFQIWLSLIHGADGICLFPISFDPFVSSQIPSRNEDVIRETSKLFERFAPALGAEESPRKIAVQAETKDDIVDVTTRRLGDRDYVFLVNGTSRPQTIRVTVDGLGAAAALHDALDDNKPRKTEGESFEEMLDGLALRIWEIRPMTTAANPSEANR